MPPDHKTLITQNLLNSIFKGIKIYIIMLQCALDKNEIHTHARTHTHILCLSLQCKHADSNPEYIVQFTIQCTAQGGVMQTWRCTQTEF